MRILKQILSFGAVGMIATATHVSVAWLLMEATGIDRFVANFCGAMAAFGVSLLGNARFTFATERSLLRCAGRYVFVTLASLALTSAILAVTTRMGLPTYWYVLSVLVAVPPTTFLLARFWAFGPLRRQA